MDSWPLLMFPFNEITPHPPRQPSPNPIANPFPFSYPTKIVNYEYVIITTIIILILTSAVSFPPPSTATPSPALS